MIKSKTSNFYLQNQHRAAYQEKTQDKELECNARNDRQVWLTMTNLSINNNNDNNNNNNNYNYEYDYNDNIIPNKINNNEVNNNNDTLYSFVSNFRSYENKNSSPLVVEKDFPKPSSNIHQTQNFIDSNHVYHFEDNSSNNFIQSSRNGALYNDIESAFPHEHLLNFSSIGSQSQPPIILPQLPLMDMISEFSYGASEESFPSSRSNSITLNSPIYHQTNINNINMNQSLEIVNSQMMRGGGSMNNNNNNNNGFKKSKRSRLGCLTCRHRKKRCCETKPLCTECLRLGFNCNWPIPGTEHKNRSRKNRISHEEIYHSVYGNIKILRGIVEPK